mgnify:CR=1 FL=1
MDIIWKHIINKKEKNNINFFYTTFLTIFESN